jgi:hypothetical protein
MNLEKCFNCNGKIKDLLCKKCKFTFITSDDLHYKYIVVIFDKFHMQFILAKNKNKFILKKSLYETNDPFNRMKGIRTFNKLLLIEEEVNFSFNFEEMANQYFKSIYCNYIFI